MSMGIGIAVKILTTSTKSKNVLECIIKFLDIFYNIVVRTRKWNLKIITE